MPATRYSLAAKSARVEKEEGSFTATDASGISHVNLYLSDDGGSSFKPVAKNHAGGSAIPWFVPNLPGTSNLLRVEAFDNAGVEAEIEVYDGALHGWCIPDSGVYHEAQAERAWSRMLALFERTLA